MGEWKNSINYHYSRGDIVTLYKIAEDTTVDEDDRKLAKKLADQIVEELEKEEVEKDGYDIDEDSDGEER